MKVDERRIMMSQTLTNSPRIRAAPETGGQRDEAAFTSTSTPAAATPGLWALIKEDYLINGCDWTKPGFRAMVMYRLGVWRMGIRWRILRAPISLLYRWMHRFVRNRYGIELHYTTKIGRRFRIAHQSGIVIHEHATIGDDCTIRQGVTLGASNRYSIEEAPRLGDRVDVGAGAIIMGKVTIGDDARIGAHAVVMADVPAGCTAFAQPARIIQAPKP